MINSLLLVNSMFCNRTDETQIFVQKAYTSMSLFFHLFANVISYHFSHGQTNLIMNWSGKLLRQIIMFYIRPVSFMEKGNLFIDLPFNKSTLKQCFSGSQSLLDMHLQQKAQYSNRGCPGTPHSHTGNISPHNRCLLVFKSKVMAYQSSALFLTEI